MKTNNNETFNQSDIIIFLCWCLLPFIIIGGLFYKILSYDSISKQEINNIKTEYLERNNISEQDKIKQCEMLYKPWNIFEEVNSFMEPIDKYFCPFEIDKYFKDLLKVIRDKTINKIEDYNLIDEKELSEEIIHNHLDYLLDNNNRLLEISNKYISIGTTKAKTLKEPLIRDYESDLSDIYSYICYKSFNAKIYIKECDNDYGILLKNNNIEKQNYFTN